MMKKKKEERKALLWENREEILFWSREKWSHFEQAPATRRGWARYDNVALRLVKGTCLGKMGS